MYYIHINRGTIDSNRKHGRNEPPIKFQKGKYGRATYAHEISIVGPSRVVYSSEGTILPCGARLVILAEQEPIVVK